MFKDFFKSVVLSDEVRYEASGLTFIIGANAGRFISEEAPIKLRQFCIRFEVCTDGIELHSFDVRIINEYGFQITETIAHLKFIDWCRPGISVLSATDFTFPQFGKYFLQVRPSGGGDWHTVRDLYVDQALGS